MVFAIVVVASAGRVLPLLMYLNSCTCTCGAWIGGLIDSIVCMWLLFA